MQKKLVAAFAALAAFALPVTSALADPNNNNSAKLRAAVTVEGIREHMAAFQAIAEANSQAASAAQGRVASQDASTSRSTRRSTAPVAAPAMAPTLTCVVDTGSPSPLADKTSEAVTRLAASPLAAPMLAMRLLIVSATRRARSAPPSSIRAPAATADERASAAPLARNSAASFGVSFKLRAKQTVAAERMWGGGFSRNPRFGQDQLKSKPPRADSPPTQCSPDALTAAATDSNSFSRLHFRN